MRAQSAPGEDPDTVPPPEAVVPDIVRMVAADHAKNGVLFDFPTNRTERLLRR
jgi:hypothetical protein